MEQTKKENIRKKFKLFSAILKAAVLVVIIVGVPLFIWFFHHDYIDEFSSIESVKALFRQYETQSVFIYLACQVGQIIICIIPGQELQIAAGFMYGFWVGYIYSVIGAAAGAVITYYLAKLLGRDAMHMIFGEEKINDLLQKLNSKKGVTVIFLIYLIPGLPKDLCNYAAGLSDMKLKPFLIISLIGRSPGMMASLLIGKQIGAGAYTSVVVIAAVVLVLFILALIFRKKLMGTFDKGYEKLRKMQ